MHVRRILVVSGHEEGVLIARGAGSPNGCRAFYTVFDVSRRRAADVSGDFTLAIARLREEHDDAMHWVVRPHGERSARRGGDGDHGHSLIRGALGRVAHVVGIADLFVAIGVDVGFARAVTDAGRLQFRVGLAGRFQYAVFEDCVIGRRIPRGTTSSPGTVGRVVIVG